MIKLIPSIKLPALLLCCGLFLLHHSAGAQTSGAGYVSSIESKAKQILALEAEIEALKQKISRLIPQKQESIDNAKRRLAEAIERTKNDESWKNRLKTAQDGWEERSPGTCGAGGPPPICKVDHWFKTSLSASMAKYNQYLENYLRPFKEAVRKAGAAEEDEIARAGRDIDKKTLQLPDLKKQLVDLSRQYETHMKDQAEKKAKSYGMDLVRILSEIHYQEDLVEEYTKKIDETNAQETVKKREATEKVRSQIASLKKKLEQDLVQLENKCKQDIAARETSIQQLQTVITDIKSRIRSVDLQLQNFKGSESQKLVYEEQKNGLQKSLYAEEAKVRDLNSAIQQLKDQLFQESNFVRNEIFKLNSDESSKIAEAAKLVEDAFATQREMLQKSKTAAATRLANSTKTYRLKLDEKGKEYNRWVSVMDGERQRVMRACQSVSCACYGTYVVNEANLAWNKTKDCLNSIDRMKRSSGAVLYSNCVDLKNYYDSLYKGYNGGNSASERDAMDRRKAQSRFENLLDN